MSPGPGNYEQHQNTFVKKKSPNWVFGTEERGKDSTSNK